MKIKIDFDKHLKNVLELEHDLSNILTDWNNANLSDVDIRYLNWLFKLAYFTEDIIYFCKEQEEQDNAKEKRNI